MDRALVWKRILLTLCFGAFIELGFIAFHYAVSESSTGIRVVSTQPGFVDRIVVVTGSPAFASGLRTGDVVDRRALPPAQRYRLSNRRFYPGEVVRVPVLRNGTLRWFAVTTRYRPVAWQVWFGLAGTVWILIFATIISARRADHAEARILALLLVSFALGLSLAPNNFFTPWPAIDAAANIVSVVLSAVSTALLATYAMRFARPAGTLRRAFEWLTYLSAAISAALGIAGVIGTWNGTIDFNGPELTSAAVQFVYAILPQVLPLSCAFLAVGASRGVERTRITWAAASLSLLYIGQIVGTAWGIIALIDTPLLNIFINLMLFAAPIGLTYSLLSRRLMDIGFALNRAAMFAATTVLLAGLFAGLQWIANQMLSSYAHATSVGVQLAIAVVVYYVVRFSRDRTDALVTSLFFAKREQRLAALRELANTVDEIRDPEEIAPLVAHYLRTHASIDAIVFLQMASEDFAPAPGSPEGTASIGKDDLVAVTLRTRRSPMRLIDEAAVGGIAFPMLIRARVRGVLLCRPPRGDNEFAPDEVDALFALASRMASARDDLLSVSLREQLAILQTRNNTLERLLETRASI